MIKWELYYSRDYCRRRYQITLVNLCGPNNNGPRFYENLIHKITECQNEQVIMSWDWNLTIGETIDSYNYLHTSNPRASQLILNQLEEENFVDPWRIVHEGQTIYMAKTEVN